MGTSMGGTTVLSAKRAAARARFHKSQEAGWAAKSGPVTISYKAKDLGQDVIDENGVIARS